MNKIVFTIIAFGFLVSLVIQNCVAQTFVITQVELEGAKLNIYYDLVDNVQTHTYTIKLFSSRDNFSENLKKVSGDVGPQVSPGNNKKIVWNMAEEFGNDFEDQISFQVKGQLYEPFLKLNQNYKKLKRGKSYEYSWTGGTDKNILNVELIRANEKIVGFGSFNNTQNYSLKLPSNIKPGKSYQLKFYDSNDQDKVVFTNEFEVTRKVPVIVKILPLAALGATLFLFTNDNESNRLPDPIKPQ